MNKTNKNKQKSYIFHGEDRDREASDTEERRAALDKINRSYSSKQGKKSKSRSKKRKRAHSTSSEGFDSSSSTSSASSGSGREARKLKIRYKKTQAQNRFLFEEMQNKEEALGLKGYNQDGGVSKTQQDSGHPTSSCKAGYAPGYLHQDETWG